MGTSNWQQCRWFTTDLGPAAAQAWQLGRTAGTGAGRSRKEASYLGRRWGGTKSRNCLQGRNEVACGLPVLSSHEPENKDASPSLGGR